MTDLTRGALLLKIYLDGPERTKADAGRAIGVPDRSIYQWLSGRCRPSIDAAAKLEDYTGGEVPIRSWVRS